MYYRVADRPPPRRRGRGLLMLLLLVGVIGGLVYTGTTFLAGHDGPPAPPPPPPPPPPNAPGQPVAPDEPVAAGQGVRAFFEVEDEGEESVNADLEVALGRVTAARAERGILFQAEVALTSDRLRPQFQHSTRGNAARVELGLSGEDASFRGIRATRGNTWRLYFSDQKPLDLDLELGAADADLDFSGIPLQRLSLDCGMASATIRFEEDNPIEAERIEIEAGLSSFTAEGLGHARFREFDFDGGAGEFTIDFTGDALRPGATATLDVGMASLTLRLPDGHPIRLDAPSTFMTRVDIPSSMVSIGKGRWATPGAETGDAFEIDIDAGPGQVIVQIVE